ncbi:Cu2+-exporting ATPase [Lachnospiraceae bacterium RM5]|nr:Cu2+-exporting ATPase [Lachnospiraceae bacterium RM5]
MEKYEVEGMSCAACKVRVEKAVSKVNDVEEVSVNLLTGTMGVKGNADSKDIIKAVEKAGYKASLKNEKHNLEIRKNIKSDNKNGVNIEQKEKIENIEQKEEIENKEQTEYEESIYAKEIRKLKKRILSSLIFLIVLMYISMGYNMFKLKLPAFLDGNYLGLTLSQMILSMIVIIINREIYISGFKSLFQGYPNMNSLIALGSSVSFIWSLSRFYKMCGMISANYINTDYVNANYISVNLLKTYKGIYHDELFFESASMILVIISFGKLLEAVSKGKTSDSLRSLMKIAPKKARIIKDGKETEVLVEDVEVGDEFIIRPGEQVPVDGIVLEGESSINESALTGESAFVDKNVGDNVSAATINDFGYLKCRATRVGKDTTFSRIIEMVSEAMTDTAPIARIADKVSGVFVPVIIIISVIVMVIWLLMGVDVSNALERGIAVLVISCPCALGLATPVAIMVGNGVGARNGILFKTSEALENAGKVNTVVLDKTGTITTGKPVLTDIYTFNNTSENELLKDAYSLEKNSEHPLAKAIVEEAEKRNIEGYEVKDFSIKPGNGLTARNDKNLLHAGNEAYIKAFSKIFKDVKEISYKLSLEGKTPVFFEKNNKIIGIIGISDVLKPDSKKAVNNLKKEGIKVVMLTGDNKKTAEAIGKETGVDEIIADVLPEDKENVIKEFQKKGKVAMVGDGINDAIALTRADVGIAIGAGIDVAIDSADVVLMNSTLMDVVAAIKLSKKTVRNIKENLFWAFFYNMICIPLAAGMFGLKISPMISALAMSFSSITVCMNALRLNFINIHEKTNKVRKSSMIKQRDNDEERKEKKMITVKINGMMCSHCEANVKKALEELDFIANVIPDHDKNQAEITLTGEFNEEEVKKVVTDKGYEYIGIM